MEKQQKSMLLRIIGSLVVLGASFLPMCGGWPSFVLCIAAYLLIGSDVLWEAVCHLFHSKFFDENLLMALASLGAFAIGEYHEGVTVMLLYQVGELFQDMAVDKSRASISSLMNIRPDVAFVEQNGTVVRQAPESVSVGSVIVVKPGEKIPLDGLIIEGASTLNTMALTGESLPKEVKEGDSVMGGCINLSGLLRICTTAAYGESTVAKILRLVEQADTGKAKSEKFITRFAKVYTPTVVVLAVLLTVIPSLVTGDWLGWLRRSLIFLVISCPCALVISVPLSFFGGIGGASRLGVLVKGSHYLESLAKVDTVVFDKTGTLTKGNFKVTLIHPELIAENELLELAALAGNYSDHPISQSLRNAYKKTIDKSRIGKVENLTGHGIKAVVDGKTVCTGNLALMKQLGVTVPSCEHDGTLVHVAVDGRYAGHIEIADEIKPQSAPAIKALKALGIKKTVMLTGDRQAVAQRVAATIGIDECHAELLPTDKVEQTKRLSGNTARHRQLAFVGDGINDAPVLKCADVGLAMGALGSDAAIEAADVVLTDDNPLKIADAIRVARRTKRIVTENIVLALCVKVLFLALGSVGLASMWSAVFADVGVSFLAILNALRALHIQKSRP